MKLIVKMKFFLGTELINIVDGREVDMKSFTPYDIQQLTTQIGPILSRTMGLRVEIETETV